MASDKLWEDLEAQRGTSHNLIWTGITVFVASVSVSQCLVTVSS